MELKRNILLQICGSQQNENQHQEIRTPKLSPRRGPKAWALDNIFDTKLYNKIFFINYK